MYAKAFVTLFLPVLAAHAMPAKRDGKSKNIYASMHSSDSWLAEYDDALSLITAADTDRK